jgi:hypothetical protein
MLCLEGFGNPAESCQQQKKLSFSKFFLKKIILTCFLVIYCIKVGTNEELECQSNIWSQKKCHYSSVLDKLIEKELYVVSKNVSKSVSESSSKKILVRSFNFIFASIVINVKNCF